MAAKRVIIVEDHQENANAIMDFVRFVFPEWEFVHAVKGGEAVKMTLENPADVMILDIALADEVNGLEVVKRLWEGGLRAKPRIVIITALGNKAFRGPRTGKPWVDQLTEQERSLVSAFFEKPYGWHAFLSAVAAAAGVEPPEKIKLIPDNE
jgi:CheY-like chemotaxis protein